MPSKPSKRSQPPRRGRSSPDRRGQPDPPRAHDSSTDRNRPPENEAPPRDRDDHDRDRDRDHDREHDREHDRDRDRDWARLRDAADVEWSPWLLIRYTEGDIGVRSIPASAACYLAPDVDVEAGGTRGLTARAGEPNFLHATVFNFGAAPSTPTKVDFYWADPSLGMGPANMNHIGTEWVEIKSIFQGGGSLDVRCNTVWVPELLNGGHECVEVHCSNPFFDPIEQPFQPRLDRHVAQRNLAVIDGQAGKTLPFAVKINNPWQLLGQTSIRARLERVAVAPHAMMQRGSLALAHAVAAFGEPVANDAAEIRERFRPGTAEFAAANRIAEGMSTRERTQRKAGRPVLARSSGAPASIGAHMTDRSRIFEAVHPDRALGSRLLASDTLSSAGQRAADFPYLLLEGIRLKSLEQREIVLEFGVPRDARPNEYLVFHLAQFTEQVQIGGYVIVVAVV